MLPLPPALLQRAAPADTIVALTLPAERTLFDVASGTLQLVVLVLGIVALGALVVLLVGLRKAVTQLDARLAALQHDAGPLLTRVSDVAADARAVTARLRHDVERVSQAANRVGDTLEAAAETTAARLAAVDRVLGVTQREVEDSLVVASSLLRGVRRGALAWLADGMPRGSARGEADGGARAPRLAERETARAARQRARRLARRRAEAPRLRPRDEPDDA